jgi:hypothetical protein
MVVFGGTTLLSNGVNGTTGSPLNLIKSRIADASISDLLLYSPTTRSWTRQPLPSAPLPRWGHTATAFQECYMIVYGGYVTAGTNSQAQITEQIWRLDACAPNPSLWVWYALSSDVAVAVRAVYLHTAVIIASRLVVYGGAAGTFHGASALPANTNTPKANGYFT